MTRVDSVDMWTCNTVDKETQMGHLGWDIGNECWSGCLGPPWTEYRE